MICHVILEDHVNKASSNFMGVSRSRQVSILPGHRHYGSGDIMILVCLARHLPRPLCPSHCVKSVHIWSYSSQYFPTFGLNTERYFISLRIQYNGGKIPTRIILNTDTFYAVSVM